MISNETLAYGKSVVDFLSEPWFLSVVVVVLILMVGLIIARVLSRIIGKLLTEIELNTILKTVSGLEFDLTKAISNFIFYFTVFIAFIMALNELGITTTVLQLLAAAVLVLIIIAFALGVKDFIPNAIAGVSIYRKRFIKVGDSIRVHKVEGKIESITLNETKLVTKKGDKISIPNASLLKSEVVKLK